GATQNEPKAASHLQIDFTDCQRPAARSKPALEQLGLAERVEDQAAWRVEDPREDDFAVAGCGYFQCSRILHRCFLLSLLACFFSSVFISSNRASRRWKLRSQK